MCWIWYSGSSYARRRTAVAGETAAASRRVEGQVDADLSRVRLTYERARLRASSCDVPAATFIYRSCREVILHRICASPRPLGPVRPTAIRRHRIPSGHKRPSRFPCKHNAGIRRCGAQNLRDRRRPPSSSSASGTEGSAVREQATAGDLASSCHTPSSGLAQRTRMDA
jgi:hypothetical protein